MPNLDIPQLTIFGTSLALFVFVLEMVRRQRLREDYSLLWLAMFGVLSLMSVAPRTVLDGIADLIGIRYSPSFYFAVGFVLLLLVLIQFSVVITKLSRENKQAAQHIAFLTLRLEQLESKLDKSQEG